ncbi:hypothetical protein Tco_0044581 [Tanacetum coccineum]
MDQRTLVAQPSLFPSRRSRRWLCFSIDLCLFVRFLMKITRVVGLRLMIETFSLRSEVFVMIEARKCGVLIERAVRFRAKETSCSSECIVCAYYHCTSIAPKCKGWQSGCVHVWSSRKMNPDVERERVLLLRRSLFNTTTGNPVKKILLKLNLSDHRSILTDSKGTCKDGDGDT